MSELLVSLAVLGLIAGLTVPSIVASVDKSKSKASMKEAIQMVSSVFQAGYLNGDFANITSWDIKNQNGTGSITNYFSSKFNYTKQCLTGDTTSKGCAVDFVGYPATTNANNHNARWILPTGAEVKANDTLWFSSTSTVIPFDIIAKPDKKQISFDGIDATCLVCNPRETILNIWGVSVKPGHCRLIPEI